VRSAAHPDDHAFYHRGLIPVAIGIGAGSEQRALDRGVTIIGRTDTLFCCSPCWWYRWRIPTWQSSKPRLGPEWVARLLGPRPAAPCAHPTTINGVPFAVRTAHRREEGKWKIGELRKLRSFEKPRGPQAAR